MFRVLFFLIAGLVFCFPADVLAAAQAGGGLPYEAGLTLLVNSVKGPVAWALSVLGLIGTAGALLFGGDMSGFLRASILIVLVICFLISAVNVISVFTGQGAVITASVSFIPSLKA